MSYFVMNAQVAKTKALEYITYVKDNCYPWNNEDVIQQRMEEGIVVGGIFNKKTINMSREGAINWLKNNSKYIDNDYENIDYCVVYIKANQLVGSAEQFIDFVDSAINNGIDEVYIHNDDAKFVK